MTEIKVGQKYGDWKSSMEVEVVGLKRDFITFEVIKDIDFPKNVGQRYTDSEEDFRNSFYISNYLEEE